MMSKPEYEILTLREQILLRPEIYINSTLSESRRNERVFKNDCFSFETIITPKAVVNIFLEILMNASDNIIRSKRADIRITPIEVTINKSTIMITNGGIPIPISVGKAVDG